MQFWEKFPEAWAASRENPQPPESAMRDYVAWLKNLPGEPVFVAYPVVFDFMFVQWYLHRFTGSSPFTFVGLDIKSYAMAVLKIDFLTVKKVMFTVTEAGVHEINFAVIKKDSEVGKM